MLNVGTDRLVIKVRFAITVRVTIYTASTPKTQNSKINSNFKNILTL